jgi:hypothetical protein
MSNEAPALPPDESSTPSKTERTPHRDTVCPVCGAPLITEKSKVVCRSERCRYRLVFNRAES